MKHYEDQEPKEINPSCRLKTDIFMDKLFSTNPIPQPKSSNDNDDDGDDDGHIPSMKQYFEEVLQHGIDELEDDCFEVAHKSTIMDIQRAAK